jgi:cobalt/nickel transport system permease protein
MHIADGIMPNTWCGVAHGLAWAAAYGLGRKVQTDEIVRMGLMASAAFVISLIHFPLGGTSVHLGLYGLAGILLGIRAFPVIFAALLFQTLLFQHGGLLSLGLNAVNMGTGAVLASLIWKSPWRSIGPKAFVCGFLGILVPALLLAAEFSAVGYGRGFFFIATLYLGAAALEGAITAAAVGFLKKAKPGVFAGVPD